jgi:hypothetical protein
VQSKMLKWLEQDKEISKELIKHLIQLQPQQEEILVAKEDL